MPFVAAAGGRPALAAAAGSMTRPPTPSETATASQRLLLGVPATATFPALDGFRARASIAREGCRAPVLPGRTRLHPASPEPPGVRTTRTTRPGTRRAATPPDRRQAAVRAGPLPPVAFRAWLLTFGSRFGRPWPSGPPRPAAAQRATLAGRGPAGHLADQVKILAFSRSNSSAEMTPRSRMSASLDS